MVSAEIDEHTVTRKAGKTNLYKLDSKRFWAFKHEVPPAIQKLLNLELINFQSQHQPLFWFSLTPGEAAKELNRVVDLDAIDRVQAEVSKRLRNKKAELEVVEKRLETARGTAARLNPIKRLNVKLEKIDKINKEIVETAITVEALAGTVGTVSQYDQQLPSLGRAISVAHTAYQHGGQAHDSTNQLARLQTMYDKLSQLDRHLTPLPSLPDWPTTKQQSQQTSTLEALISTERSMRKEVNQISTELERRRQSLETQLGGRCPSCGGVLTNKSPV
jgi:hypothetical protein